MPAPVVLEKAFLVAVDTAGKEQGDRVVVQFNPESLKVSFANQIAQPQGGGNQSEKDPQQFVGAGTTKLAVQLWFDVTVRTDGVNDVRKLTEKVAAFITPEQDKSDKNKFVPPKARFGWGTFQYDGIMESLEESLEFFSNDGRPLRASVTFTLSQQRITKFVFGSAKAASAPPGAPNLGQKPLDAAPSNGSVQQMAAAKGKGNDWQSIAAANKIENPRSLAPGTLLDLNVRVPSVQPPSITVSQPLLPQPPRVGLRR
ncbi:hypothetical protein WME79_11370 [Sorangium sp. So ce726]|uniref:CIS tube protein n=1 Tax=Sorangium sp. So ce726 TaxID=3133319 RepID=UPI003F5E2959